MYKKKENRNYLKKEKNKRNCQPLRVVEIRKRSIIIIIKNKKEIDLK